MLVLLYACGSKNYGEISRSELTIGLKKLAIKNQDHWANVYELNIESFVVSAI